MQAGRHELREVDTKEQPPTAERELVLNTRWGHVEVWIGGHCRAWFAPTLPGFPAWLEWAEEEYGL